MREASYFVERLAGEQMPLAGLVVNRVHETGADGITAVDAESAAQRLVDDADDDGRTTGELLTIHAERMSVAAREERLKRRFGAAHPGVPTVSVAALAGDVHDLDGLRRIGDLLAGEDA
jgi:anion-transporting  ArsA/GET3 family ATPase